MQTKVFYFDGKSSIIKRDFDYMIEVFDAYCITDTELKTRKGERIALYGKDIEAKVLIEFNNKEY